MPHDTHTTGFIAHDHSQCREDALSTAERLCAERGLRLTPVRLRVLEILLEGHKAQGAYDILAKLAEEGLGSQPPVVYRALNFLLDLGLVHRIEKLNAYVACAHTNSEHVPAFLICRECSKVAEAQDLPHQSMLEQAAKDTGFVIESAVLEVEGLCPNCQKPD